MAERQIIIHRTNPQETRIQNSIIWDKKLSLSARFSLIAMLSLPASWDYSVRGMATLLDITKDTMSKYLRELEAAGYLKREQRKSEKGTFAKIVYIMTDSPGNFGDEDAEEPCPKKSDTDAPPCPNLSAPEKSPQKKRTEEKKERKENKKEKKDSSESDMLFDRFWQAYPKKKAKQDAMKAWAKLAPDMDLCREMSAALKWQKQSEQWTRDGGQYIPHPGKWLRQRLWEDEPDELPSRPGAYNEEGYDGI